METQPHNIPDDVSAGANETEKRLLDSALSVFSEKGYDGASIREIIERAGVTRPVLYYYFENKEQLFCRLVESWFHQVLAEMDGAIGAADGLRGQLVTMMRFAFEHAERSAEVVRLIFHVFLAPSLQDIDLDREALVEQRLGRVVAIMKAGMATRELREGDPELVAMAFCGMMDYYLMFRVNTPGMTLAEGLAESLVDLFLDGTAGECAGRPASLETV
ncbi:MAG: TetR/AcrR family transcriptional regulator [bacterium]|nr:TetR/AcrR family transcriptional regulator [bacterium]